MNLPEHMKKQYGTERVWKEVVRLRLRLAKKALDDCRFGCMYTPDNGQSVVAACDRIDAALEICNHQNWGR